MIHRAWRFFLVALLLIPQVHHFVPHHHHGDGMDGAVALALGYEADAFPAHGHGHDHDHAQDESHALDSDHFGHVGHPDVIDEEIRKNADSGFDDAVAILPPEAIVCFVVAVAGFVRIESVEFPVSHGPPLGRCSRAPPVV